MAAGVSEVQYIEPYPKSKALELHSDAITTRFSEWRLSDEPNKKDRTDEPSKKKVKKVLFRPFVGVAPRLYPRAFIKARELKDAKGNFMIGHPEWTEPTHLGRASYTELEAQLARVDP